MSDILHRKGNGGIEGLSHLTFVVRDIEAMGRILTEVLGAERVYASGEETFSLSPEAFFVAGGLWIAVMQGTGPIARSYTHVAFKLSEDQFDRAEARLRRLGLEIRPPRPRVAGEGHSLYFYDHDNHLFELHTGTLDARLARYDRGRP